MGKGGSEIHLESRKSSPMSLRLHPFASQPEKSKPQIKRHPNPKKEWKLKMGKRGSEIHMDWSRNSKSRSTPIRSHPFLCFQTTETIKAQIFSNKIETPIQKEPNQEILTQIEKSRLTCSLSWTHYSSRLFFFYTRWDLWDSSTSPSLSLSLETNWETRRFRFWKRREASSSNGLLVVTVTVTVGALRCFVIYT